ncbi:MAG: hypothetical protein AAF515_03640 [Pseudomonadota bacterium]
MKPLPALLLAITLFTALAGCALAPAGNGQQCAATSTLRGQSCDAPLNGYANQAQCVAAYNACLNAMPRLMHRWCVKVDQPNCVNNDDCPKGSCCNVRPVNQKNWKDLQCHQTGRQNRWRFAVFDVADCKCDCTKGPYPEPPEGPEGITLACDLNAIDCSGCSTPGSMGKDGSGKACLVEPTPWEVSEKPR